MAQIAKLTATILAGAADQAVAHGLARIPTQIYIVEKNELTGAKKALLAQCFTKVISAEGSDSTKVKTTAAAAFLVAGVHIAKAATDDFWTLTNFDCTQNMYNVCLLCIDAAGAMQIAAGTEAATLAAVVLADTPANSCVVAMLSVNPTTGPFTGGTTDLAAANINPVYTDLGGHPDLWGEITLGKAADATNVYVDNSMQSARAVEIIAQTPHSIIA